MSEVVIKIKKDYTFNRVRISVDGKHIHDIPAGNHASVVATDLQEMFERLIDTIPIENTRIELD